MADTLVSMETIAEQNYLLTIQTGLSDRPERLEFPSEVPRPLGAPPVLVTSDTNVYLAHTERLLGTHVAVLEETLLPVDEVIVLTVAPLEKVVE
ncbi:hypothetical protein GMRT_jh024 [Giardia muris]|uniref:Uncharacterized protein n=1 Tax=Giardia muris TaxID=5742 RepID=A0A4Z1SYW5_GIAMU|nr:hypothetical protein GMRT_jh024 [Giardia muris]|eukprot:TNJ28688.1 hypothetical protein GMRT_jh024 [Giardia muris]